MRRFQGILALAVLLLATNALAQSAQDITACKFDQDLYQPPVIEAVDKVIDTTFRIQMRETLVPVWVGAAGPDGKQVFTCSMQKMQLRTYGWPSKPGSKDYTWGYPGPTLRLKKADAPGGNGDKLKIKLVNELPLASNDQCNPGCDCSDPKNLPQCCKAQDVFPGCFHGENNTNLHFHGTHVSPQPPQDYVLLELRPQGSPPAVGGGTHSHGIVAIGSYQYAVDGFRWTQSEGTHWYHPHKHGSTALQVSNGMAGALLIEGKFDEQLDKMFTQPLEEKVLVLQLIHELNFTTANQLGPQPLINGQASPVIHMRPGQIQRWRFVGATHQADGAVTVDFNSPKDHKVDIRQIQQDGVQFAPENYVRQPLVSDQKEFDLAPGNRADFLVKAPLAPGDYWITYELKVPDAERKKDLEHDLRDVTEFLAPGDDEPRLLILRVDPCPEGKKCEEMKFPTVKQWPATPDHLDDIEPSAIQGRHRNLFFEMENPQGNPAPVPSQPSKFFINLMPNERRQFDPSCAALTMRLNQPEEWTILNTSNRQPKDPTKQPTKPLHVFHIHTNPFQLVHHPTKPKLNTPPYVWFDSVLLPNVTEGPIRIRHNFTEFTGEYVLHCHFLGHEDRGMMLAVQTVCPDNVTKFGRAGRTDECKDPNELIPAAPQCYPRVQSTAETHDNH